MSATEEGANHPFIFDETLSQIRLDGPFEIDVPLAQSITHSRGGDAVTWVPAAEVQGTDALVAQSEGLMLALSFEATSMGGILDGRLMNRAEQPILLHTVTIASIDLALALSKWGDSARLYQHGYQSWTPSGSIPITAVQRYPRSRSFSAMNHDVDSVHWGRKDGIISSLFTALSPQDGGQVVLIGSLTQRIGLSTLFFDGKTLDLTLEYAGKVLLPGEALELEPLFVGSGNEEPLFDAYALLVKERMAVQLDKGPVAGWCSWYEFYTKVTAQGVEDNLQTVLQAPELKLDVIQLDDGYQTEVGDWLSINEKFPDGLEPLVAKIRDAGYAAGIWLAPFMASAKSELFTSHPEWFVHDALNRPVDAGYNVAWRRRTHALDVSNPHVLEWLGDVFGALRQMGFTYFKLDFLFAGLRRGSRSNQRQSPVEAYRNALQAVRDAVGPEAYLLGCGAPLGPSIGMFDAMRVSADVREVWWPRFTGWVGKGAGIPSARDSLRNNLTRAFMHWRWWVNDPDCLLVRERNSSLTIEHVQLLTTVIGLSGGAIFLSDDLSELDPERFEMARSVLPLVNLRPVVQKKMVANFPAVLVAEHPVHPTLALINPSNEPEVMPMPFWKTDGLEDVRWAVFDFWQGSASLFDARPDLALAAQSVRALTVTQVANEPAVIGTNVHLNALQTGMIKSAYGVDALNVFVEPFGRAEGAVWIYVPDGLRVSEMISTSSISSKGWASGVVLDVPPEGCTVEVRFEPAAS